MIQILVFVVLVGVAVAIAAAANQRRDPVPTRTGYTVPEQLNRNDFARPDAPWLVVLFSSSTCNSCAKARQVMEPLASPDVATQEVEVGEDRDLHDRYVIEAVPTLLVADADGAVVGQFLGPPTAADLWATLADLREPGSVPPGCDHGAGDAV
jgi:thioredoxin-related protein